MALNVTTIPNEYVFGRGKLFFDPLVNGINEGFRQFGNCPSFTVSVETEKFEHTSSTGGIGEVDFTIPISITRAAEITCDNLSNENLQLFFAADLETLSQTATPVTDEVVSNVNSGRSYQLGATPAKPAGVRGVSAVAVRIGNGDDAVARVNSTPYVVGDVYVPAVANAHWYACTVAGTSAGTPPTFTTDGTTFADGTATFRDMGLIAVASTTDINYRIDATHGLLSIVSTGTIATAVAAYKAVLPTGSIWLNVDYTPAANSRDQLATSANAELAGRLMFIADNPSGTNRDLLVPSATLSPSGSISMITGSDIGVMTFAVGINKLDSDTPAILINGQPVS